MKKILNKFSLLLSTIIVALLFFIACWGIYNTFIVGDMTAKNIILYILCLVMSIFYLVGIVYYGWMHPKELEETMEERRQKKEEMAAMTEFKVFRKSIISAVYLAVFFYVTDWLADKPSEPLIKYAFVGGIAGIILFIYNSIKLTLFRRNQD